MITAGSHDDIHKMNEEGGKYNKKFSISKNNYIMKTLDRCR